MVLWSEYNQFEDILNRYLPDVGQGDTKASQAVTCINKLILAFYKDSDISSKVVQDCTNWLYTYLPATRRYLTPLESAESMNDYSDALYALADKILDERSLQTLAKQSTCGQVYSSYLTHQDVVTAAQSVDYINELLDALNTDESFSDVTNATIDDDNIVLTLSVGKQISNVTIPIQDLTQSDIDKDLNYIFSQLSAVSVRYNNWELIDSKQVTWNSKSTRYNMWYNATTDKYVFTLGYPEVSGPGEFNDWEEDTYDEAVDWFNNWTGDDTEEIIDDDVIQTSTEISKTSNGIVTPEQVIKWLAAQDDAAEALHEFHASDLNDIDYDDLFEWIIDRDLVPKLLIELGHPEFVDADSSYVED